MSHCDQCGRRLDGQGTFCDGCGSRQVPLGRPPVRRRWWLLALSVVAGIAGVVVFIVSAVGGSPSGSGEVKGVKSVAPASGQADRPTVQTPVLILVRDGADIAAIARRHGLDPNTIAPPGALGTYRVVVPYERAHELVRALAADADVRAVTGPRRLSPA